eukprot:g51253.t1
MLSCSTKRCSIWCSVESGPVVDCKTRSQDFAAVSSVGVGGVASVLLSVTGWLALGVGVAAAMSGAVSGCGGLLRSPDCRKTFFTWGVEPSQLRVVDVRIRATAASYTSLAIA